MNQIVRQTPRELAAQEDAMRVALGQPHRNGRIDPKLESALGRFCDAIGLGEHCYGAGVDYRNIVIESLRAQGLPFIGWAPGDSGYANTSLTDAQRAAMVRIARKREDDADAILIAIMPRLKGAMKDLCYRELDPIAKNHGILRRGLIAMSDAWGLSPRRSWE